MRRKAGVWWQLVGMGILVGLTGCGGGTPTAPTSTPCTQTPVDDDSGAIGAQAIVFFDFSVPDTGRLDVTLDWTLATSPIGFYIVPANTCTNITDFNNGSCNFLVRSEPSNTKPKKISTPNFAAGNYRWLIANFADVQESISYQIVLSKGNCPALSGVRPSVEGAAAQPRTAESLTRLH